jgi:monoamine oxidase
MAPSVKSIDLHNTEKAYFAPGTMTRSGPGLIHVSGQVGATKNGHVPSDYESQIHLALLNLRKVIIAGGATVKDIAKLTLYIVNYDPAQRKHTRIVQRFLSGHRPAITLVPVAQLAVAGWLFEVDAVVALPEKHLSLPPSLENAGSKTKSVDVVILGAGLAGLSAARDAVRGGLSCVVLEARDRVGGRTWSQLTSDGKGILELGAAWINDVNQTNMIALARQYGLELIEQNTTGNCVFQGFDGKVSQFPYGQLPDVSFSTSR